MRAVSTSIAIPQHEEAHDRLALDLIDELLTHGRIKTAAAPPALHIAARGWRAIESALRAADADEARVWLSAGSLSRSYPVTLEEMTRAWAGQP